MKEDFIKKVVNVVIDVEKMLKEARDAYEAERLRRIMEEERR